MRNQRIDSIKGFLILLVVLGHLIGECDSSAYMFRLRDFIYVFHMPLFVLLSGYFSSTNKGYSFIGRLIYPLVVFQLLSVWLSSLNGNEIGLELLYTPYWTLWYLASLILWKTILMLIGKNVLNNPYHWIILTFMLSALVGLSNFGKVLSIQRTINFLPFFLIGYLMRDGVVRIDYISKRVSYMIITATAIVFLLGLYPNDIYHLEKGAEHYGMGLLPIKSVLLVVSLANALALYRVIPNVKLLCSIGKDSLFYYLYHGIIIRFLLCPIIDYYNVDVNDLSEFLLFAVIIVIMFVLSKIKVFWYLIFPHK